MRMSCLMMFYLELSIIDLSSLLNSNCRSNVTLVLSQEDIRENYAIGEICRRL